MEITSKSIAVWGSPSSGKTITATKLALEFARKDYETVLVLCDTATPMLPCLCPPSEIQGEHSLGSVFASPVFQEHIAEYNRNTIAGQERLYVYGYLKGECHLRFPACTPEQAKRFLEHLAGRYQRVVLDCSCAVGHDMLTAAALLSADKVLRLVTPDIKAASYLSTQLELLGGHPEYDASRQIKALSQARPPLDIKLPALNGFDYRLPYSQTLEEAFLTGKLLQPLTAPDGRAWEKQILSIASAVEKM